MATPAKIFISYSHKDAAWLALLQTFLAPLVHAGAVDFWSDIGIQTGDIWRKSIEDAINEANIGILLVSPNFLASDFIHEYELPRLIEAEKARKLKIVCIAIRECLFQPTGLGEYQFANDPNRPMASLRGHSRDAEFTAIARKIAEIIRTLSLPEAAAVPKPLSEKPWNIPQNRNPFFIGREKALESLHSSLVSGKTAAHSQAIRGLGGVGKTQTAIEYAYRYQHEYSAILWTGADTEADLSTGFVQIASVLGLKEAGNEDQKVVVTAVKNWLENNTGWLLIFDNANTPEIIKPYRPHNPKGHILLTSRAHTFDTLGIAAPTELDSMDPDEAINFVYRRTGRDGVGRPDEVAAKELAHELGYFPLALEQAGAYILANNSSFQTYLTSYRKKRSRLLEEHKPVVGDYMDTIATTWSLNIAEVEKASRAAADLLRVSAFLSPDNIPFNLIIRGASQFSQALSRALENTGDDPLAIDFVVGPLTRYSLVRREGDSFSIHPLVQAAVLDKLGSRQIREWSARVVRGLNKALPDVEFRTWKLYQDALPHVNALISTIDAVGSGGLDTWEAVELLNHNGCYLLDRARYSDAAVLFERTLVIMDSLLAKDQDVATILNCLAVAYERQGRDSDAEQLYLRSLDLYNKEFGPNHPETAPPLSNLADFYRLRKQYSKAEPLYVQALEISEVQPGPHDQATAVILSNLALLYHEQKLFDKAQPLYERSLAILEESLPPDHSDIGTTLYNMAGWYRDQGLYGEAEPLYKRAVDILEASLGDDHPTVARVIQRYGDVLKKLGREKEGSTLMERAEAIWQERGEQIPDID